MLAIETVVPAPEKILPSRALPLPDAMAPKEESAPPTTLAIKLPQLRFELLTFPLFIFPSPLFPGRPSIPDEGRPPIAALAAEAKLEPYASPAYLPICCAAETVSKNCCFKRIEISEPVLEKVVSKNDAKVFTPFIIEKILNNELKLPSLANPVII